MPEFIPREGMSSAEITLARKILGEVSRRSMESLRLYEPMPIQAAFHSSHANERVIRGGNRGGKTLAAAVEVARALCGCDPHDKYPKTDGICYAVGKDQKHIGRVLFKKLFRPGPFEVIKDLDTGRWRPALPIVDDDREDDKRPAQPLIPRRMYSVKGIAWENKRDNVPRAITLRTGWEIHFFSSLGEPSTGVAVDIVWFDEEIEHPMWYPEMSARLIDRRRQDLKTGKKKGGKFLWSATPQAGTQKLYELCESAENCKGDPDPLTEEFHVTLLENEYLTEGSKREFIQKLEGNEDEIGIRVYGNFALLGRKVYPEFAPKGVHGMPAFPIPDDWTRYIAVDPGRQVCAVLFAAVPPSGHDMHGKVVLYDELYIKKCNAQIFAERLRGKLITQSIRLAIIDHHAGRQTEIGSGLTVEQQYVNALKGVGVSFESGGSGFAWGSDDVQSGLSAVRSGLHVVDGQSSRWIVFHERVPYLIWEAGRYVYKKHAKEDIPTDEPLKMNDHLMDCWRYLAMHTLRWVKSKVRPRSTVGYVADALARKRARTAAKSGWGKSIKVG